MKIKEYKKVSLKENLLSKIIKAVYKMKIK